MGSPQLKKKKEMHYRRGYTHSSCDTCNDYVSRYKVRGIGGEVKGEEPRCKTMGLKGGRAYRIGPNNICDKFDNSKLMERLRSPERS